MSKYRATYELRRTILFGAVASGSLIFSVLFLLFLSSHILYHHSLSTDTISEMMGYAQFFLLAYASYFTAAVLVWRCAEYFSRYSVSWLIISLFGSVAFSFSSMAFLWISSPANPSKENPFEQATLGVLALAYSAIVLSIMCVVITSIGCGLVSAFFYPHKQNTALPH